VNKLAEKRDRLRENYDIRNKTNKQLTRYQQTQRRDIEKQISEHMNKELRNKIFNTFD
jgi:hypothetical protein